MAHAKLDVELAARTQALKGASFRDTEDERIRRGEHIKVLLRYEGSLAALEAAGFCPHIHTARGAMGTVAVGDLERLADVPGVVSIVSDRAARPLAGVRTPPAAPLPAAEPGSPGVPGLDAATALPPLPAGYTGQGVVVGIIDTGVDIFHPAFLKPGTGTGGVPPQTRIVSLFDVTLRQTITVTGNPTGGDIVFMWEAPGNPDERTAPLLLPLQAPTLQTALEAFAAIDAGDVQVTGGPLPAQPLVIDFTGNYDGSRIESETIQEIRHSAALVDGTDPKVVVTRGRVFTEAEINTALQAATRPPFPSRDTRKHGTEVASVAAGSGTIDGGCCVADRPLGIAPQADLVVVHTNLTYSQDIQAVKYIFGQPWLAPGVPRKCAVVNMSFAGTETAHDGTDPFEVLLDDLLAGSTRRSIVAAAGNEGDFHTFATPAEPLVIPKAQPSGGLHTLGRAPARGPVALQKRFAVEFADLEENDLHLWYSGPGVLRVNLVPPPNLTGTRALPAPLDPDPNNSAASHRAPLGPPGDSAHEHTIRWNYRLTTEPHDKRHLTLTVVPPPHGHIAIGTWTLTLQETAGFETAFDIWSLKTSGGDPPARFLRGDQDRTRTIGTPAAGVHVLTVGAYHPDDNSLAPFSSRGPTTDLRLKPEVCAPGMKITAALSGARAPASYTVTQGTSIAAPYVAGVVALMFQANGNTDHDTIVGTLVETCDKPPPPRSLDDGWGAGRVHPERAVNAIRGRLRADEPVGESGLHDEPPLESRLRDGEPVVGGELHGDEPVVRGELHGDEPVVRGELRGDEPVVLPPAAYPAARLPTAVRLRQVRERAERSAAGRLAVRLIAAHHDEVRRLAAEDRRVLVAWHRAHGPLVLRRLLLSDLDPDVPLPRSLGGGPLADGLARLLDALESAGSPALRADVSAYRDFALALPGARLSQLDTASYESGGEASPSVPGNPVTDSPVPGSPATDTSVTDTPATDEVS
ncbi:S8 family serine peptidase [Streptomyces aureocirculatus]|uniref:S8 family serine peptidase n=1 Tax=Streptomyces aureocirculatus TaxID=67275 RepID=UPI0004C5FF20|nr:S8 family serine peptidase [Streptomyces aureocirculatus]